METYFFAPTYQKIGDFKESEGKKTTWIQVFKATNFLHPELGDFTVTKEDLEQFVVNFRNKASGSQPSLNLNHKREEAAGWFINLETRKSGTELWGEIEWTPLGIDKVEKGLFRYVSAEMAFKHFNSESKKVTKNVMTGAALTNHPFMKGMEAVNFSEAFPNGTIVRQKPIQKERTTMKLSEIIAALAELGYDFNDMKTKAAKFDALEINFEEYKTKVPENLVADFAEEKSKREAAEAKIKKIEAEQVEAQFSALVEEGMKAGKLTKEYAEGDFKELFDKMGHDFAKKQLDAMAKTVETDFSGSSKDNNSGDVNTQILKAVEKIQVDEKCDFETAMNKLASLKPALFEEAEKFADAQM
jgi:phage I-like protein